MKRFAVQSRVVRTADPKQETGTTTSHFHIDPDLVRAYAKVIVTSAVAIYWGKVAVDTASKVVVNLTSK